MRIKPLFPVFYLIFTCFLLCISGSVFAQGGTGQFCFTWTLPAETANGAPASTVGFSSVYFEIARKDSSGKITYQDSHNETDMGVTSYCFENVPVGPGLLFANRVYDVEHCAGITSTITTHEVFATRDPLKPAVVNIQITGTQPEDPPSPILQ